MSNPISFFIWGFAILAVLPQARASFHLMQIEKIVGGVSGNTNAQAIQIRMRADGQNLVSGARIRAWNAAGASPVLIVDMSSDVPNGLTGRTVLIASPDYGQCFAALFGGPDFTMENLIPPSYLSAGSLTFESDGGVVYWRVSWGGAAYTGSHLGDTANDPDGNFGPAFAGPLPSSGIDVLNFSGSATDPSTSNVTDYALTNGQFFVSWFRNNIGSASIVNGCIRHWNNPTGGPFLMGANWDEGSPPGLLDGAVFSLGQVAPYTVSVQSPTSHSFVRVIDDNVIIDANGGSYDLTGIDMGVPIGGLYVSATGVDTSLRLTNGDFTTTGLPIVDANVGSAELVVDGTGTTGDFGRLNFETGLGATAQMRVLGGASVSINGANIGYGGLGSQELFISAAEIDSTASRIWVGADTFIDGIVAHGLVTIQDGGALLTGSDDQIAGIGEAEGTVLITGVGSRWNSQGQIVLGRLGGAVTGAQAHVEVLAGGSVTSASANIGEGAGTVGTVSVDGLGSRWDFSQGVIVGGDGEGLLAITNEGVVTAQAPSHIGSLENSIGEMIVTGTASQFVSNDHLIIGHLGDGSLHIENGGSVSNTWCNLGEWESAIGTVVLAGAGSTWDLQEHINIGVRGHGTLSIENGGAVTSGFSSVGNFPGSIGEVNITDPGSTWSTNGLFIGAVGTGTLQMHNGALLDVNVGSLEIALFGDATILIDTGAVVTTDHIRVVDAVGSSADITVSGLGSALNVLLEGLGINNGDAIVRILNGGTLSTNGGSNISLGYGGDQAGSGTLIVDGPGSQWLGSGFVGLGWGGSGVLTISSGGIVSVGSLAIGGGGGDNLLTVDGAGSELNLSLDLIAGNFGTHDASLLTVTNGGLISATISIFIGPTCRLRGNGSIEGVNLGLTNQGRIEPGLSAGLLIIDSAYNQGNIGITSIELGGLTVGTQHDQLAITGSANLSGRLGLDLINGFVPSAGDSFDIMTYGSVSGRFQTIISDNLPPGLQWALDYNPTVLTLIACDPIADPSCDDCNLNGILDGEDIANMTSSDNDFNGIPDECTNFVAACFPPTDQWSCFDNWDLPGDQYPDDVASASGVFVTLNESDNVVLNVNATIPGLRILDEAELHATGGNLLVYGSSDTLVESKLYAGDFNIDLPNSRLVLPPGGVYAKDALEPDAVGVLSAQGAYVFGNGCSDPPCPHGGEIELSDSMTLNVNGDLVLDGRLANGPCAGHAENAAAVSFHTPPSIRALDASSIIVTGTFSVQGNVTFAMQSTLPATVGGHWENQSTNPECFECRLGKVILTDSTQHNFEVAGTDEGPTGTVNGREFVMGELEVAPNAVVDFRDAFDNNGVGPANCGEALYVEVLTIGEGATVNLHNCRIYYETLNQHPTAIVNLHGCGELMSVDLPSMAGGEPGGVSKSRALSLVPPGGAVAGGSSPMAMQVRLVSLHHVNPPYTGGPSIPFHSFEGQIRWVGPPSTYLESASSGVPFKASVLQCTPHYQDWSTVGLLHVFGTELVPSSVYEVRTVASTCQGIEHRCTAMSSPLTVATSRWGDVETPFNPPSTSTQPDLGDVSALVNKFRNAPGAPIKARALLVGIDAVGTIDVATEFSFIHIAACVDAFRGRPYPHTIQACP